MTNEIVKLVAKKAKISEPIAQIAVDTVLTALKGKLPPAAGSILDTFLSSGSTASTNNKTTSKRGKSTSKSTKKDDGLLGGLGNIAAGALGGLLSGKK